MDDMQALLTRRFPRRQYLSYEAIITSGASIPEAMEAVSSTAIEHPEWDMEEQLTWAEWESQGVSSGTTSHRGRADA